MKLNTPKFNVKEILKKKVTIGILSFFAGAIILGGGGGVPEAEHAKIEEQLLLASNTVSEVSVEKSALETKVKELEAELKSKEASLANANEKLKEAEPFFALEAVEKQKAAEKAAEEARVLAEAKAKADAEAKAKADADAAAAKAKADADAAAAKAAAEAKAKEGYNTGITYAQLARDPDDYTGKLVKFKGKVIQVMEGNGVTQLRLAVNSDYDDIVYLEYESDLMSSRVLEDDIITIMGMSAGLLSYKSTLGGTITIPSILVDEIQIH